MPRPFAIYDNWSVYDELSDDVPLTEELAMVQFDEVCRLRKQGVRIDGYLMDAFWYEEDGGYRTWKKDRWPNGPDRWLAACAKEGIQPGLWFPANTAFGLNPPTEWRDSLASDGYGFSCFEGGFLDGYLNVLRAWYGRGVRIFKFDFAKFEATVDATLPVEEVRARNISAFRGGLAAFLRDCPDATLLGYNGFEDVEFMPWTDRPQRHVVDQAWLSVFTTVYCGDPRPADLPCPDFFRSSDVYADAMIYLMHRGGWRLADIDNCAFMIGRCGTCYHRGSHGWRTTLLLSLARAGSVHVAMGNLEALDAADVEWYARVQRLFDAAPEPTWLGGNPGQGDLYGYRTDELVTVVNPSLLTRSLKLSDHPGLMYADGFVEQRGDDVVLGAGAVAVLCRDASLSGSLGQGAMAPVRLDPVPLVWEYRGKGAEATWQASDRPLHLTMRQIGEDGLAVRSTEEVDRVLEASTNGFVLPLERRDREHVWSGLSWAYGVVTGAKPGATVRLRVECLDGRVTRILPSAYVEGND